MAIHRIALTGAQGTGKSTLARALVARFKAAGRFDVDGYFGLGVAIADAGHRTGALADAAALRHFAEAHMAREAGAVAPVQVFDRCLLDALAYARVLGCLDAAELATLTQAAQASCGRIAQLLWLRITSDYPVLNERDESLELRRAIDAAIGQLARAYAVPLIEHAVPPDSIEGIVEGVLGRYAALEPIGGVTVTKQRYDAV